MQAKIDSYQKKIKNDEFIDYLEKNAIIVPRMDFIPEFRNFVQLMQAGLERSGLKGK